jgi:hypothetical protein
MLREPLLHIANKLLGRQNLNFDQLTPPEQKLWNFFEKSDIYEFLTGEKDYSRIQTQLDHLQCQTHSDQ